MARSKTYTVRCEEPGCREYGVYEYERKTDKRVTGWRCARHRHPEQIITLDAPRKVTTLTVIEMPYGRFWSSDGEKPDNGMKTGPGFKAWAKDFEVGTTLTITAELRTV
jgi:hypothetical protein